MFLAGLFCLTQADKLRNVESSDQRLQGGGERATQGINQVCIIICRAWWIEIVIESWVLIGGTVQRLSQVGLKNLCPLRRVQVCGVVVACMAA